MRTAGDAFDGIHIRKIDLFVAIIVLEIAQDGGRLRIARPDIWNSPKKYPVALVEVRGVDDVCRDVAVAIANAIDLHGELHRNFEGMKFTREFDNRRGPDAVTVEDDVR